MSKVVNTWYEDEEKIEDIFVTLDKFEFLAAPKDLNTNTIFNFIESGAVKIPGSQRSYVWDKRRASKLIESILIDIPIPQLYIYEQATNNYLVMDGHQRLMTIYYFRKKRFPKPEARVKLRRVLDIEGKISEEVLFSNNYFSEFNLVLNDPRDGRKSPFHALNYSTLAENAAIFDLKTIRTYFIKHTASSHDDSSAYELFDRLNSAGANLEPQEIRTSLYQSAFYDELNVMNLNPRWRDLLGQEDPDIHMKDVEILLRGFAMLLEGKEYADSMMRFLNSFSLKVKRMEREQIGRLQRIFEAFLESCSELGDSPFTLRTKRFNVSLFEAAFVAICEPYLNKPVESMPKLIRRKLEELKRDQAFISAAEKEIARKANVDIRLNRARVILKS